MLRRYEAIGDDRPPDYLRAVAEFYRSHLCRRAPWPPEVTYSLEPLSLPKYGTRNGANEFSLLGTIRHVDLTDRLHEISVPTLVTCGPYDEVAPAGARSIRDPLPGAALVAFPESSPTAFWDDREGDLRWGRDHLAPHPRSERRPRRARRPAVGPRPRGARAGFRGSTRGRRTLR